MVCRCHCHWQWHRAGLRRFKFAAAARSEFKILVVMQLSSESDSESPAHTAGGIMISQTEALTPSRTRSCLWHWHASLCQFVFVTRVRVPVDSEWRSINHYHAYGSNGTA